MIVLANRDIRWLSSACEDLGFLFSFYPFVNSGEITKALRNFLKNVIFA
jgi:hypothetical protein